MIERRILLASIAAVATAPALAQAPKSQPATTSAMPARGAAEDKHAKDTMTVGALALLTSRIARQKASDARVKQFAEFETAEQETIADVLMTMQDPSKASGRVNAPSDSEAQQHLDSDGRAMVEKMRSAQAGAGFDQEYVRGQIDGHNKLLRIQEDYLASGKDPNCLNAAKMARGQIKEHLALLANIQNVPSTTGQAPSKKK